MKINNCRKEYGTRTVLLIIFCSDFVKFCFEIL